MDVITIRALNVSDDRYEARGVPPLPAPPPTHPFALLHACSECGAADADRVQATSNVTDASAVNEDSAENGQPSPSAAPACALPYE